MTILKYELRGFDGSVLDEDLWIELENEYILKIRLTDDFKRLEVILKEDILYQNNKEPIDKIVTEIFVNILLKIRGHFQCPELVLTEIIGENNGKIENRITFVTSKTPVRLRLETKNVCDSIVGDNFAKIAEVEWQIVYAMLQNKNQVVTFMELYDYLMEIIWKIHYSDDKRAKQCHVIDYLEKHKAQYGDDLVFLVDNKGKIVDLMTYRRNEIGHARMRNDLEECRELGNRVDEGIIRLTLRVINDVLMEQN